MYWTQSDAQSNTMHVFMETLEEYHAAIAKGMRKSEPSCWDKTKQHVQIMPDGVEFLIDGVYVTVCRPNGAGAGHEIKMLRDKTYAK